MDTLCAWCMQYILDSLCQLYPYLSRLMKLIHRFWHFCNSQIHSIELCFYSPFYRGYAKASNEWGVYWSLLCRERSSECAVQTECDLARFEELFFWTYFSEALMKTKCDCADFIQLDFHVYSVHSAHPGKITHLTSFKMSWSHQHSSFKNGNWNRGVACLHNKHYHNRHKHNHDDNSSKCGEGWNECLGH